MALTRPGSGILKNQGIERRSIEDSLSLSNITRQSVQTGRVDSNGVANFLSVGAGLSVDINAVSDPLVIAFADGYDKKGSVDKIAEIVADINVSLAPNATNYIYADRDPNTGAITYGATKNLPPIYGTTYQKAGGAGKSYISLDGVDGATAFTDANGNAWTFLGNAQLDTAQKKFGTSSVLLDGTGDYLEESTLLIDADVGFQLVHWIRLNSIGILNTIQSSNGSFEFRLNVASSNVLNLSLGDGGGAWSIADSVAGTTALSANTWYRVRTVWDTAQYKVYLSNNGATETEEISITSTSKFKNYKTKRLGYDGQRGAYLNGWIDDFSYEVGPQTLGIETPSSAARGSLDADKEHWFDLNTFKMKYWDATTAAYIEKQRVFLGEAVTDGSTVTSVVTYALKGRYDSDWFDVATSTTYIKTHNIGSSLPILEQDYFKPTEDGEIIMGPTLRGTNSNNGARQTAIVKVTRRTAVVRGGNLSLNYYSDTVGTILSGTTGRKRIILRRGW